MPTSLRTLPKVVVALHCAPSCSFTLPVTPSYSLLLLHDQALRHTPSFFPTLTYTPSQHNLQHCIFPCHITHPFRTTRTQIPAFSKILWRYGYLVCPEKSTHNLCSLPGRCSCRCRCRYPPQCTPSSHMYRV